MKNILIMIFCVTVVFAQSDEKLILPKPIKHSVPIYPAEARRNNISGIVWLKILVDTLGIPKEVYVQKSDNEILNQPSIDAGKQYRFTPATQDGKPVEKWISLPFKFRLEKPVGKIPNHYKVD